MYLIGTDEAGYGPNLGPLVVSATLWRIPDELAKADLYEVLAEYVVADCVAAADPRLPIADSKQLYRSGDSWLQLELGLLAALEVLRSPCWQWSDIWRVLATSHEVALAAEPWHREVAFKVPFYADRAAIEERAAGFAAGLALKKVELLAVVSRPVFAAEFNAQCALLGNKSSVLSHATLGLVAELLASHSIDEPLVVHCDKHGGRNYYAALLQHFFPDDLIVVQSEGRAVSSYCAGSGAKSKEFRFVAKGEEFLPAALASMACKYLRELSMHAFNRYWQQHLPGLKATAGYPEDAKRFHREIAATQKTLGITDDVLWRVK